MLLGLGRLAILTLLTLLVLRGTAWARWVLAALLSFATLVFLASVFQAFGHPMVLALFLIMAGLHIWAVVELAKSASAGPSITRV